MVPEGLLLHTGIRKGRKGIIPAKLFPFGAAKGVIGHDLTGLDTGVGFL